MKDRAADFLAWMKTEKGRQPRTIAAYGYELNRLHDYLSLRKLDYTKISKKELREYFEHLGKTSKASARARALSAIKAFYKFMVTEEIVKFNPTTGIDAPRIRQKMPHPLTMADFLRLLGAVNAYAEKGCRVRDYCLLATLFGSGIRLSELKNLDIKDFDSEARTIRVIKKGGNEHVILISSELSGILKEYAAGRKEGPFFMSNRDRRMHEKTIYKLVKKYMFYAGLDGSPHTLRATCFTEL